jgi:hypothetical protein
MSDKINPITTLQYENYENILTPAITPDTPRKVTEGYTGTDLKTLYTTIAPNRIGNNVSTPSQSDIETQRKYDMDEKITYPPNHPEYKPSMKEVVMNDTTELLDQQYNTLIMTVAATASLGIIVFMITSTSNNQ